MPLHTIVKHIQVLIHLMSTVPKFACNAAKTCFCYPFSTLIHEYHYILDWKKTSTVVFNDAAHFPPFGDKIVKL